MRVVIADDAALMREGLARLLAEADFEVVGEAGDADELMRLVGTPSTGRCRRRHQDAAHAYRRGNRRSATASAKRTPRSASSSSRNTSTRGTRMRLLEKLPGAGRLPAERAGVGRRRPDGCHPARRRRGMRYRPDDRVATARPGAATGARSTS